MSPAKLDNPRLAVLCDFHEEGWPSMDLVADMLVAQLSVRHAGRFQVRCIRPAFRRHLGPMWNQLPALGRSGQRHNLDRILNRHLDYPRLLRREADHFDLFHICDHSYAQLVHSLPAERTGVFCHDLDTFRCLLEPQLERRPGWFKFMARRTLRGLQKAAVVFYTTEAVRGQIEKHGLLDPGKLVKTPLGVAGEFTPQSPGMGGIGELAAQFPRGPFLLHVGSCIPRKRIDVLLAVFAEARARQPGLELVQVGGTWSGAQLNLLEKLGVKDAVRQMRDLPRTLLAEFYRRAALVLVTSEAEGFGLPLIEALACGGVVVASDLAAPREAGEDAVVYCPVADIAVWAQTVVGLLADPALRPLRQIRLARAAHYSWDNYADVIAHAYATLLQARGPELRHSRLDPRPA